MANICFVANFHKTFFFHELSTKLQEKGTGIFWIVTKAGQFSFLKKSYPTQNILYLNRQHSSRTEALVDDFKINELAFGDRVLKHELENGIAFLSNIQKPIYDFISLHKIRFIFGEITWAHELLLHRMASQRKELNCQYLECSVVRIPNGRFGFFKDETQYDLMEFDEPVVNEIFKIEKPSYLKINDKIVSKGKSIRGRLDRLKRFVTRENIESNDPNVITNVFTRFKVAVSEELNKNAYNFIGRENFETIKDDKFIFYGFHKQPEASIDVMGRYYEDQFVNVLNLWRMLPPGWKVVVKEHTNAIGDRSYKFYRRLKKIPNIIIANERIDSKLLIEQSSLVASVTGTVAYEAALMRKPAVTFSKIFFNRINYCRHTPLNDMTNFTSLTRLIAELNQQEDNRLQFSNYIMKNTFEGNITDPYTDPTVLAEENLEKVCHAFLTLIERYK